MTGGGIVMVVLMILILPVAVMLGGAIWSAADGVPALRERRPRRRGRSGLSRHSPGDQRGDAEAVADRAHGLDQVGVLLAELGPEAPDVDVDRAGAAVVLVAPHP